MQKNIDFKSGFLVLEALIALAILVMVIPAAVSLGFSSQELQAMVQNKLDALSGATEIIANGPAGYVASSSARYLREFGQSTCTLGLAGQTDFSNPHIYGGNLALGAGITATDAAARNSFVYMTADSAVQSAPDFFIIDARDPASASIVASVNTGPGLSAVAVSGHYAYVANESSLSQLEVIDLIDRSYPVVAAKLKLPLPTASSTAPHAASVFYRNGIVFLGTEKWDGDELAMIDVHNPSFPTYMSGFDTDTVVNAAYTDGFGEYLYVADADTDQIRTMDISDPADMRLLSGFSPTGSAVLEGKAFAAASGSLLYFGRSGGGFDNPSYDKLFLFDLSRDPLAATPIHGVDVPGGVYGIVASGPYVFLAVGNDGGEAAAGSIQIWQSDLSGMVRAIPLSAKPVSLACDHGSLYAALAGQNGLAIMSF